MTSLKWWQHLVFMFFLQKLNANKADTVEHAEFIMCQIDHWILHYLQEEILFCTT